MSGSAVKTNQESEEFSNEINTQNSTRISSIDATSIIALLKAAISLLEIKIKTNFDKILTLFTIISLAIPFTTLIFRLVGRFIFWIFWTISFYGTMWAFGYFNRSNCHINGDLRQNPSHSFYISRKIFILWFLLQSFFFLIIGWYLVLIRGPYSLYVIYFWLFAALGLIYGLGDVTCPHCGAINAGQRIISTAESIEYRCCVCKQEFSHSTS